MDFAVLLKQLRTEKGLSQAALAKEIFVSRSAVAKWENGLGLPGDESLRLLAEFFEMSPEELLPNKSSAQEITDKNQIIEDQSKLIIGFTCIIGLILTLFGLVFSEPLRDCFSLIVLGVICVILGSFNIKGNIASIHWYNRRKVTKENQLSYCRLVGFGTVLIGVGMILSAVIQVLINIETGAIVTVIFLLIGLSLIVYAQIKYNRGIF